MKKRCVTGVMCLIGLILSIIGVNGYVKTEAGINQNDPMFYMIFVGESIYGCRVAVFVTLC